MILVITIVQVDTNYRDHWPFGHLYRNRHLKPLPKIQIILIIIWNPYRKSDLEDTTRKKRRKKKRWERESSEVVTAEEVVSRKLERLLS